MAIDDTDIRKTPTMLSFEAANGGTDIRLLILEALRNNPTDYDAASTIRNASGDRMRADVMSRWISTLHIINEAQEARKHRVMA